MGEIREIDNFSLECYRNCPRFYYWRIERGLTKPKELVLSAQFGSSIHRALETYYKGGMTDKAVDKALITFAEDFKPYETEEDKKRTAYRGVEILEQYFERYHGKEPFAVIATEIGGAFEIGEYVYHTRIDLIVEWDSPKGIYVVDHKTSSQVDRIIPKPNNQLTGYEYNARLLYEDVHGTLVNVIGVFESDETIDKTTTVLSEKTGRLVYAKKRKERFVRMTTSRTPMELEEWRRETVALLERIEESRRSGIWPRYTSFCGAFRRKCHYIDLCNSTPEIAEKIVASGEFSYEPWKAYERENGE
jgi:hypothetical protein